MGGEGERNRERKGERETVVMNMMVMIVIRKMEDIEVMDLKKVMNKKELIKNGTGIDMMVIYYT